MKQECKDFSFQQNCKQQFVQILNYGLVNVFITQIQIIELNNLNITAMKGVFSKHEMRKPKTAYPSKKNSNASSLIYKEITSHMDHLFEKQKQQSKDRGTPQGPRNQKKTIPQKYSLHNIKKKSSVVSIPFQYQVGPQLRENLMFNHNKQQVIAQNTQIKDNLLEKKMFKYQYIIGKGGFGKVWRVEHTKNRNQYALKQMLKSLVMTKKSVQSVMNQRMLLSDLNSPFIVNMHYAFQDRDTLYLVLDLMQGGDLRYHIGNKNFSEIQAKFFVACIILGLQYLHSHKIIHRDIKPQNLVLDSRGYVRITDLGIARIHKANNSTDTSGTPGYMSPQVICRQNHTYVSDFFALGVIAYQLMTGRRPYQGRSRAQIRDHMLAKQVLIKASDIPEDWSYQAADFINKLIQRKPENRMGFSGVSQIKNHPWVRELNWKKLLSKQIESPFIPFMKKSNFDQDDQITIEDQDEAELIQKNSLLLRKTEFQELFKNYYFDGRKEGQVNQVIASKNNFFNQNEILGGFLRQKKDGKERQTKQKISLKKAETSVTNSRDQVKYKKSLETVDSSLSRDNRRKQSKAGIKQGKPGLHLVQSHQASGNHIPYAQEKKFFKEFRF